MPARLRYIPDMENMSETTPAAAPEAPTATTPAPVLPPEVGGAPGPEPTRYGDWAHKGRCTDF